MDRILSNFVYTLSLTIFANFQTSATGISSRNLYFRKVSGQNIDKKPWLSRDIQNIVMYFKLRGWGNQGGNEKVIAITVVENIDHE